MKKKELKKLLKQALRQLEALKAPETSGPTLSEWLTTYRTIIGQQTIRNRSASQKHIERLFGESKLKAIKPFEIASKVKELSAHTAVRVLGELRDVYVEAIANGIAETNPAAHVKAPIAYGLRKRLPLETWQAMWALSKTTSPPWVQMLLLLGIATGQRRADLAKMKFSDVVDGHLRIEQQKKARKLIGARVAIPLSLRLEATGMTLGDVIELCKGVGKPGETLIRRADGKPIEMSSLSARFREHIVSICGG